MQSTPISQFSIAQILMYHLLPGIPILLLAILFANPYWGLGLPIFLALMLAILFGLIPVQLGILAVYARKQDKSIRDIICFRKKMSLSRLLLWSIPLLLFTILIFMMVANMEHGLWTIFDWVPEWFRVDRFSVDTSSGGMIVLMLTLGFLLNGILGPLVEEIYFRGFLLPRMDKLGGMGDIGKCLAFFNLSLLYSLGKHYTNLSPHPLMFMQCGSTEIST